MFVFLFVSSAVVKSEEFLALSAEQVCNLISNDNLTAQSEKEVCIGSNRNFFSLFLCLLNVLKYLLILIGLIFLTHIYVNLNHL